VPNKVIKGFAVGDRRSRSSRSSSQQTCNYLSDTRPNVTTTATGKKEKIKCNI
jgi:hypothetical protein